VAHRRLLTLVSAPVLSLAIAAFAAGPAAAAGVTPPAASTAVAHQGASYLAGLINGSGFIPTSGGTADLGSTAQAILALHAAGVGGTKAAAAATYFSAHVETYITPPASTPVDPGRLAYAILVAEATGADPTAYGTPSTDLVAQLVATQRTSGADIGLFGAAAPTFDGAFRQGLALTALSAAGVTNVAGTTWLTGQQCSDGGWEAYRSSTVTACTAPDPANFDGEDTNDTAFAVEGLVAQGSTPVAATVTFLHTIQASDGGFGDFGGSADPDSDGLVLQALAALGEDASSPAWTKGTKTPYTSLASFQLSCATATPGAFFFPGSTAPSLFALLQAIPGAAAAPFPIAAGALAAGAPSNCPAVTTSTSVAPIAPAPVAVEGTTSTLPFTGSDDTALVVIALLFLASGTGALGVSRRRAGADRP
jgi:hypothetical protein